jgi:hypothetical protein
VKINWVEGAVISLKSISADFDAREYVSRFGIFAGALFHRQSNSKTSSLYQIFMFTLRSIQTHWLLSA